VPTQDCQLGRLRSGRQHEEIEGAQEERLLNPAPLIDKLAVHDRYLPRGAAEVDEAELQPEAKRLGKAHDRLAVMGQ
jgi:hypothetical protein